MIIDSSALVAIVREEPEGETFQEMIAKAASVTMSAANLLEAAIVVDSAGDPATSRRLDTYLETAEVSVAPVTVAQAVIARQAYRDFGKRSGHPAQLNFGDCFAYALAAETREPILFKGSDFNHTDLVSAV